MNFETVILFTLKIRAISDFDIPCSSKSEMVFSLPVSLTFFDLLPTGLPNTTPSAFFRASASFVR
jgi:hypothetical protein